MTKHIGDTQPLLAIMQKLRDPETGCPWDLAQSFKTIVPFTIEEAYEVADAIERMAMEELPDELGDLLFQVVFYCQLGKEQGLFDFDTVVERICNKLTRRHPHVFDGLKTSSTAEIKQNWEQLKETERSERELNSVLDDIPQSLPALSRSIKIQKRVARVGFDWAELEPVVAKIHEEIDEVLYEVKQESVDENKVQDEMGDLLFAVVNLARHLGVEPEQALRQANHKFERRFRGVEAYAQADGRLMTEHTLTELDGYWDKVKLDEANK
ncbi:nucleoside triphosphate pyrophosphohydrolase [Shewanella marinintestina]|uniref:nucleoside triphosphate pyrophosphohydrolase n=1 Tax=Shewanella marinintestina TaxID=190305 RepID=UPI00200CCE44|nr:nucleoside triphosphate pyrophosphohydrolase [Shewanella marinintestina]MCL1147841.1 nucleoside triphosphate pyrophosphohydrolase [Shewanella marinintestina]